jgi:type IV pilus assembly protein PilC
LTTGTELRATDTETTRQPAVFKYVARSESGKKVRGVVEARSPRGARTALMEQGLEPIRVTEKLGLNVELTKKKVKEIELVHFSRQLAVFVKAGIPILEAIESLADGADNSTMRKTLFDVNDALRSGQTLSESFAEHPKVFPKVYTGAIKASERTGRVDAALERLADYLERVIENKRKLQSAFMYPAIVLILAVIVVGVLTAFVLPRFQGFIDSLGGDMPLPTRMLVNSMDFFTSWWWLLALIFLLAVVGLSGGARTERGRARIDAWLLKTPLVGRLVQLAIVERFCFALGSMVEAAVTLPEALEIAGEGTNNAVYRSGIAEAREQMMQGQGIAEPLGTTGLFPMPAVQMIRAGERAGTLEVQLLTAAEFYGKELDYRLDRATALFEPAIIIAAGAVVGFVAIALVSAIYGLISVTGL